MKRIHELRTLKPYFEDVLSGIKTFEYRNNDRDFAVGDELRLKEIYPFSMEYTGREYSVKVEYILKNFPGLPKDYCVMSVTLI